MFLLLNVLVDMEGTPHSVEYGLPKKCLSNKRVLWLHGVLTRGLFSWDEITALNKGVK